MLKGLTNAVTTKSASAKLPINEFPTVCSGYNINIWNKRDENLKFFYRIIAGKMRCDWQRTVVCYRYSFKEYSPESVRHTIQSNDQNVQNTVLPHLPY